MQQIVILALIVGVVCSEIQEESFNIPAITDVVPSKETHERQSCDTVFCAYGKECVMKKRQAVCECIEKCVSPYSPVCGSNGAELKTYNSECHLYKAACEQQNSTITMVAETSCEKVESDDLQLSEDIEKDEKKVKPVVCMEKHRDSVRLAIIDWISHKSNIDIDEISYKGLLMKYFVSLDTNKDNALDTTEFMKILEEDESMTRILGEDAKSNPILKGVCSTELIAITDDNSDYKLEFDEFHKCLDPVFKPPKDKCELKGTHFKDGDDILMQCNACKCACGHWVCTHLPCTKDKNGNDISIQLSQNQTTA